MSILTDFLKLFKYTQEDKNNNVTFNIETALNENWDKIEANTKAFSQTLEQKAPIASPNFTGTPKVNNKDIATTDKIDILIAPESGFTVLKNNSYKDCMGAIHFDFAIQKNSGTFSANEIMCGFSSLFTDMSPISVMFLTTDGFGYDGLCLSSSSNKLQTLADVPSNCNKIHCRDVI